MIPLAEFVRTTDFFLIAHRGASGSAPENTIEAIELAIDAGVAMVEIDVQSTLDGQVVVFHDDELERTTDGRGAINAMSYEQLRTLDAGSWFGSQFANTRIPLLSDAIDVIQNRVYLNLELKAHSTLDQSMTWFAHIHRQLDDRSMLPYTVFSSFHHDLLRQLKVTYPSLHTCALHVPSDDRLPSAVLASCNASAYGCSLREATAAVAKDCREHSIPWGVYNANTPEQIHQARSLGVTAAVTNNP